MTTYEETIAELLDLFAVHKGKSFRGWYFRDDDFRSAVIHILNEGIRLGRLAALEESARWGEVEVCGG